jgi:hypothetical protein
VWWNWNNRFYLNGHFCCCQCRFQTASLQCVGSLYNLTSAENIHLAIMVIHNLSWINKSFLQTLHSLFRYKFNVHSSTCYIFHYLILCCDKKGVLPLHLQECLQIEKKPNILFPAYSLHFMNQTIRRCAANKEGDPNDFLSHNNAWSYKSESCEAAACFVCHVS